MTLESKPMFDAAYFINSLLYPPITTLRKHRIQMAFKDLTGILEILRGVRFRGCYAFKGFV